MAREADDSPTRLYRPRPSLAGPERCIRQLTYQALGITPKALPGRSLLVFDDSSWHEELTKDLLRKSVYQVHSEQMPVDIPAPGLNRDGYRCETCGKAVPTEHLHGHLDWILTDPLQHDTLVEHKALSHAGFERLERGEMPWDHLTQTCLYSAGLQQVQPDLKDCVLVVKNKNNARYLEYTLRYDANTDQASILDRTASWGDGPADREALNVLLQYPVRDALQKFRLIEQYRMSASLPPRPFEIGTTFPCGYCSYTELCWESYTQEFEAMTDDAQLDTEVADLARLYLETSGHAKAMEQEKDELRKKLRDILDLAAVKGGAAGEYVVMRSLRHKTHWLEEKIPAAVAAVAKEDRPFEVLTIRRRRVVNG